MQTYENSFHCRGCHSIKDKNSHSQKSCIVSKRQLQQAKEDLDFERNEFISKYNLKRKSTSTLPKNEIVTTSAESQATSTPNKKAKLDLTICDKPRTLKIKKIAPIQQWYGPSHNHQAKK